MRRGTPIRSDPGGGRRAARGQAAEPGSGEPALHCGKFRLRLECQGAFLSIILSDNRKMNIALLNDARLLFIMFIAAVVSTLTTISIAARPAAIRTRQVALSLAVSSVFFMFTRFANLFYLPIMATYVDNASRTGRVDLLYQQIQWVVLASALGALFSWIMLPTFTAVYERGISGIKSRGSMLRMILALPTPRGIKAMLQCFHSPFELKNWLKTETPAPNNPDGGGETAPAGEKSPAAAGGGEALKPSPMPKDVLLWNIFATAVWTVGALAALYVSAKYPDLSATSVLLSGVVNSFAAIAFSIFVDPKAAVITDEAVAKKRPDSDVMRLTFHLGMGNFIGGLLGLLTFPIAIKIISFVTEEIGKAQMDENLWLVVGLNVIVYCLMCTSFASRASAVITRSVATALAIYNVFSLITRLTTQVYAPILGAVRDSVIQGTTDASSLIPIFRWVIFGSTLGALLGWLLLPTFIKIYNTAIKALENRGGSMGRLLTDTLKFRNWPKVFGCLCKPTNLGVIMADLKTIPQGFLWANVIVIGIHVIGVLAAIQAGAVLSGTLARTATLLSSVINGVATILGSLVVDPTAAKITDEAVDGKRTLHPVEAMVLFLTLATVIGTVISQLLFIPSVKIIILGAEILNYIIY